MRGRRRSFTATFGMLSLPASYFLAAAARLAAEIAAPQLEQVYASSASGRSGRASAARRGNGPALPRMLLGIGIQAGSEADLEKLGVRHADVIRFGRPLRRRTR